MRLESLSHPLFAVALLCGMIVVTNVFQAAVGSALHAEPLASVGLAVEWAIGAWRASVLPAWCR
jgi:hypothetical protein